MIRQPGWLPRWPTLIGVVSRKLLTDRKVECNAPHNVYTTQHMSSFYHHDKLFAGASLRNRDSPLYHKERSEKCRQNKVRIIA